MFSCRPNFFTCNHFLFDATNSFIREIVSIVHNTWMVRPKLSKLSYMTQKFTWWSLFFLFFFFFFKYFINCTENFMCVPKHLFKAETSLRVVEVKNMEFVILKTSLVWISIHFPYKCLSNSNIDELIHACDIVYNLVL